MYYAHFDSFVEKHIAKFPFLKSGLWTNWAQTRNIYLALTSMLVRQWHDKKIRQIAEHIVNNVETKNTHLIARWCNSFIPKETETVHNVCCAGIFLESKHIK